MGDKYEGQDEATLNELLSKAENYDERSAIRKAIRNIKGSKAKKQVGSSNYRRAGWQAPKSMLIPNSVTGNVLPNKVNVTENKVEAPQTKATISYLKSDKEIPYGEKTRRKSSGQGVGVVQGSSSKLSSSSPRESVSSYTSVTPEPKELAEPEKAPEVVKAESIDDAQSPEPPREPTPEPPREPTPEPPREPTPEPPREPTPEPEREPSPPLREPTPEPPREPTPEPPREPTPEPIREPTPEPEPSPAPQEESTGEESEEGEESEDEEEEGEDEGEDDEDEGQSRRDTDSHQYRGGRPLYDPSKVGVKTSLPIEVLAKKEEGIDGDFRIKLRKAEETKIDTTKAFPQAKAKGEQVDFRNVLRRTGGPEKKDIKTGAAAQSDFRSSLRGRPSTETPPDVKPKGRRRHEEPVEEDQPRNEEPEPVEHESEQAEPEPEQTEPEPEPEPEPVQAESEPDDESQQEEPQEQSTEEQVDAEPEPEQSKESGSYEERVAERRRRRAEKSKERDEEVKERTVENGTGTTEDSYEARREARRKAREERLKAASAMVDDKPRMSYRERKALEAKKQMDNARDSRNKWANREEESGEKADAKGASYKKKDSATQQLLAWCQHKTKYYENVEVKDFRQSWSDGMAFCAILHSFLPDKIPYDDLSPSDPRTNFTIAFEAAKEANIPEMLDVEDMMSVKVPDAKSIMTFLVTIYQHFN